MVIFIIINKTISAVILTTVDFCVGQDAILSLQKGRREYYGNKYI